MKHGAKIIFFTSFKCWSTQKTQNFAFLHTFCVLKAFYKTNGDVYTQSVQALVNQVNVQTGNGAIADIKARFWQA